MREILSFASECILTRQGKRKARTIIRTRKGSKETEIKKKKKKDTKVIFNALNTNRSPVEQKAYAPNNIRKHLLNSRASNVDILCAVQSRNTYCSALLARIPSFNDD